MNWKRRNSPFVFRKTTYYFSIPIFIWTGHTWFQIKDDFSVCCNFLNEKFESICKDAESFFFLICETNDFSIANLVKMNYFRWWSNMNSPSSWATYCRVNRTSAKKIANHFPYLATNILTFRSSHLLTDYRTRTPDTWFHCIFH